MIETGGQNKNVQKKTREISLRGSIYKMSEFDKAGDPEAMEAF